MEVQELLADHLIADPIVKYTNELLEVHSGKSAHPLLDVKTAELGLLLLNKFPGAEKSRHNWSIVEPVEKNSDRYRRIDELVPAEGWQSAEIVNLLNYFFGA